MGRGREESQKRKSERRSGQDQREKVRKGSKAKLPKIRGSRGLKNRLAKVAGAEPCGQIRDEKKSCIPLLPEVHVEV